MKYTNCTITVVFEVVCVCNRIVPRQTINVLSCNVKVILSKMELLHQVQDIKLH